MGKQKGCCSLTKENVVRCGDAATDRKKRKKA
jgi:hypothetical protein